MSAPLYGQDTPGTPSHEYNLWVFVIEQLLAKLNTIKLVQVVSCSNTDADAAVGTVTVQPMVNQLTGNRVAVAHGQLQSVPYFRMQGGARAVILDPQPGDIGLAAFCDRDSALVRATKQIANPGSDAKFDWSDGLYLGGFLNGVPTSFVQFDGEDINVTAAGVVNIQSNGGDTTIDGVAFIPHEHLPGDYNIGGTPVVGDSGAVVT